MKPIRRGAFVLLAVLSLLVSTLGFSGVAQAASDYDNLLHTSPSLFVYTDGSAKSQKMDISQSWYNSYSQAYAARMAQNQYLNWPTNFMTELDAIRSSGGSWGLVMWETSDGNVVNIFGSRDPNATCGFNGDASTGSFQCNVHAGYGFIESGDFTYNTYGGGSCNTDLGNICSNDGMVLHSQPVVVTGSSSPSYMIVNLPNSSLSQWTFYTMHFNTTYPDGSAYAGAIIPTSPPPATYVAMGDSYSSGEGNFPYEAGTDQDGDFCHRNTMAYPRRVESTLNLGTTAFVACSGATIHDILNNNMTNVEYAQALFISPQTKVITMSIGGNDVQFGSSVTTCTLKNQETADQMAAGLTQVQADQADCAQALSTSGSLINNTLSANLTSLYNSVESITPTAKLLIVGYPQLYPEYSNITGNCEWGITASDLAGVTSGRAVSSSEVSTIRSLTTQLNGLIKTAVDNTNNSNIVFVDPTAAFAGHELCTSSPWFNGVIPSYDNAYIAGSYHPNAAGQTAYASVVGAEITSLMAP